MSRQTPITRYWDRVRALADTPFTAADLADLAARFGLAAADLAALTGHPGYAVSRGGRVFSRRPASRHPQGGVRELKPTLGPRGYLSVSLRRHGHEDRQYVHRLVAISHLPPPGPGQDQVRHLDGQPTNNDAANLAWGSAAENAADSVRLGRTRRGVGHPSAKLTPRAVADLRRRNAAGESFDRLAREFGVTKSTVWRACRGLTWASTGETGLTASLPATPKRAWEGPADECPRVYHDHPESVNQPGDDDASLTDGRGGEAPPGVSA